MRPTLQYRPTDYLIRQLLVAFSYKKPITSDLQYRIKQLSQFLNDRGLGFLLHYYLDPEKKLTHEDVDKLRERLLQLLQERDAHLELPPMRPALLQQIRALTTEELILYHGNQFLTGAPFFPGGITHTLYFQWGNLFGVAKYVILEEERALESNVLIHFENRHERTLEQCIHDYQHRFWLQQQMHPKPAVPAHVPAKVLAEALAKAAKESPAFTPPAPSLKPTVAPNPALEAPSIFKLPTLRLTLGRNSAEREE